MSYDRAWGMGYGFGNRQRFCFDPGTLLVTSLVATAVGGGLSAASTIAGGNAAKTAGQMKQVAANNEAAQLESNAAGELAASQRRAAEARFKARMTQGTMQARAAGSGFNAATGSMLNDEEEIVGRGELSALTDVFNGENARSGLQNRAGAVRYGGEIDKYAGETAQKASYLAAAGTIAGTAGSMMKTYGDYKYPRSRTYG